MLGGSLLVRAVAGRQPRRIPIGICRQSICKVPHNPPLKIWVLTAQNATSWTINHQAIEHTLNTRQLRRDALT